MWPVLLFLLLPPTVLRPSRAEPSQGRVPLFRITQFPWGSAGSNATGSPCEGIPSAGATALTLANRSLERLPSCLPPALRSLDGSHNLLRSLSAPELGHLSQLQVLTLRHNRIATLHWGPGGPAALHSLDLSYNRIAALPPCAGPALRNLRALTLVGNPLPALQPRAFACFPELRFLNLSCTELGRGAAEAIAKEAFAGVDGAPLATLEILDLSGTSLERVESGWMRDLPNLTSLYLRGMPRLRTLEGDIFKMTPRLQHLDCQDSPALTSVHTAIFQDTPRLQLLLLQNCNLSSFPPWTLNSSQLLSINLFGNPLTCSCELSWLLADTNRTVLSRAADTKCAPAAGSSGPFPAPLSLLQLHVVCQTDQSTTPLAPNASSFRGSTHAPSIRGLSTGSTQSAGGQRSVTKAPRMAPLTGAAGPPSAIGEGTAACTPSRAERYSKPSVPPRAASTAESQFRGAAAHGAHLVREPGSSATSTPPASQRPGPVPAWRDPLGTPQPQSRTRAGAQAPHASPSQGENAAPDSPRLQEVSETTDTWALVRWCAPNSVVRGYQIRYSAEGQAGNTSVVGGIPATAREHPLYGLAPATTYRVCVLAANRAGLSRPQAWGIRSPCAAFSTRPSSGLILAGLCATSGLLLACSLVLAACLCRRCRTPRPPQPQDTHLVAYRNPAFDYPLKLQTLS
uniref:Leucine rich repeat neuronal 4 n=1 Tax=Oryctolagus cuniculus TaxID=9986 RepID=G1TQU9_RABIT